MYALERHDPNGFVSYVRTLNEESKVLTRDFQGRVAYYAKCKNSNNPKMEASLVNDPHYRYFMMCQHKFELAIPILEQVHNQTLRLYDQNLSVN